MLLLGATKSICLLTGSGGAAESLKEFNRWWIAMFTLVMSWDKAMCKVWWRSSISILRFLAFTSKTCVISIIRLYIRLALKKMRVGSCSFRSYEISVEHKYFWYCCWRVSGGGKEFILGNVWWNWGKNLMTKGIGCMFYQTWFVLLGCQDMMLGNCLGLILQLQDSQLRRTVD